MSQITPFHIATFYVKVILINPPMCLEGGAEEYPTRNKKTEG